MSTNIRYGLLFYIFIFSLFSNFFGHSQSRAVITGTVSDQFGKLPGAKVSIEGIQKRTTTDLNGEYTFEMEEGEYVVQASFVMYKTGSKTVVVKVGDTIRVDFLLDPGFSIDQPITIGSRVQPRSLLETTSPIDIVSPQEITESTQIELSHILHYLVPTFYSTNQTIADGTDHIDPATLRGMGPDQVLVLINGKRRHNTSLLNVNGTVGRGSVGTDFNAIPVAAIDRIEILRDGATSQYGSDAIGGVINIILKKQTETIEIRNSIGITTEGDGLQTYSAANFGLKIKKDGFVNITAEYRNREFINRAGAYTGRVYSDDVVEDQRLIAENNFFDQIGYDDQRVMQIGNAETRNLALMLNSEIPMSDQAILYFSGGRNYREGMSAGFYRFPKDQDRVVLDIYPNGFSPKLLTDIQDDAVTIGVRGLKNKWNVDFSHTIGVNTLDYTVNNSNNASLGTTSPRTFYAGGFMYKQNTTNLDITRTFDWFQGTNIAFGAELRVENYQIKDGDEASFVDGGETYIDASGNMLPRIPGAQIFPGIQPENELNRFRTNSAAYLDVETSFTKKLLFKAAARYEAYNDFKGQVIGKLSGRYSINDGVSLRAGISTGFRAPSLHQLYFQNVSSQFVNGEIIQVGTFNSERAVTVEAFQIPRLKPELSNHFTAGVSAKLNGNLTFTFDYYLIYINDRIVLSGRFGEGFEELLEPFNVGAAQFLTNAIDSRSTGVDAAVVFKTKLGDGNFNATLSANVNTTKVVGDIKVSPSLTGTEDIVFNREEIARVESAQPLYKVNSIASYALDKFKFQIQNTLFGEVTYIHPEDGDPSNWVLNQFSGLIESRDQTFSPKLLTDLAVSYQLNNYAKFTLGGNNILDVYPDAHTHSANTSNGNFIYSRRVQQFGVNGANYYIRLLLQL